MLLELVTGVSEAVSAFARPEGCKKLADGVPNSFPGEPRAVDEIANARMGKQQHMRCSPGGAHGVAVVRAAVSNRRVSFNVIVPLAA